MVPSGDADYFWLTHPDNPMAVAGCITAVSAAAVDKAATILGANWDVPVVEGDARQLDAPLSAAFAQLPNGCIVVENDGFQGARSDVLVSLSRISEGGRAASIFWNVNGLVIFGCAQRGKTVAVVELGARSDDVSRLPSGIRRLVASITDQTDLVAVGSQMVEQFTGVGFSNIDLQGARRLLISPPPPSGDPDELEYTPLYDDEPQLVDRIARLSPRDQRKLAEWVATLLVDAADAQAEPAFQAIIGRFGKPSPATVPPESSVWFARLERETMAETFREGDGKRTSKRLRRLFQLHWTVSAAEFACHPDPQTAAWRAVYAAILALTNAEMIHGKLSVEAFKRRLQDLLA